MALKPTTSETQPQFAIRYHEAMARSIPDTEARNNAMFDAWFRARGDDDLEQYAARKFPEAQFRRVPLVAVFEEHETREGPDETPVKYSRDDLAAIVENMNERIRDRDSFRPISDGHTTRETPSPEVLGYAGPFYLGQIGRVNPTWAIFQSEHHYKDAVPTLAKRPARSVEVWRASRMRDRYFHPIAALGSEAPRLDLHMPALYGRWLHEATGEPVERYSGPVMPSATSVFVPSMGQHKKREQYEAGEDPTADKEQGTMIDASDLQKIVSAVVEEMATTFGLTPKSPASADVESGDEPMGSAGEGDTGDESELFDADNEPQPEMDDEPQPQSPPTGGNPVDAPSADNDADDHEYVAAIRALQDQLRAAEAENAKLKQQLQQAGAGQQEAYRREQYQKLRAQGYQLDVAKEMDFARELPDKAFKAHLTRIAECYQRVPMASVVPELPIADSPVVQGGSDTRAEKQAKAEQYAKRARQICMDDPKADYGRVLNDLKAGART